MLTTYSAHRGVQLVAFARRREKTSKRNTTSRGPNGRQQKQGSFEGGRDVAPEAKVRWSC